MKRTQFVALLAGASLAGAALAGPALAQAAPDDLGSGQVKALQAKLNGRGFGAGQVDGLWGPRTAAALRQFQAKDGLPANGQPTGPTMVKLGLASVPATQAAMPASATMPSGLAATNTAAQPAPAMAAPPAPMTAAPPASAVSAPPPAPGGVNMAQNTTTVPGGQSPAPANNNGNNATTGAGNGIGSATDKTLGTNVTGTNPGGSNAGPNAAGGDTNQAVATTNANAMQPAQGANSFTQGEAQGRIGSEGYQNVSGLKLDNNGVWRGTAMKNGQQVQVWMDYKGNIGQQ